MQEIRKEVPKYRLEKIQNGTETIITYVSEDGMCKSQNKSTVLKYESNDVFLQIKKKTILSRLLEYETWYFLQNEEEFNAFINHYGFTYDNQYMEYLYFNGDSVEYWELKDVIPLNEWICIKYEDGGDHRGSYGIDTASYIIADLEEFIKEVKE